MKLKEFKESLKKKSQNLKEIKIGLKEAQRVCYFNSYNNQGIPMGWYIRFDHSIDPVRKERARKAYEDLAKCIQSYDKAKHDYRARHIAYCLFRGKNLEEIENNYYDGKWDGYDYRRWNLKKDIDKWLNLLYKHNKKDDE